VDDHQKIRDNLLRVQERIDAAARKVGRRSDEITLIGVSKTHPAEAIRAAYEAGLRHFGENRVQEWEGKRARLVDLQANWHLVGHLQSNKAARAAGLFHSVDSVDDLALAQRLESRARRASGWGKIAGSDRGASGGRGEQEWRKARGDGCACWEAGRVGASRIGRPYVHSAVSGRGGQGKTIFPATERVARLAGGPDWTRPSSAVDGDVARF